MNYIVAQAPIAPLVPTVYLDFPPDLLVTLGYVMFAGIFHFVGWGITKMIYGH